MNKFKRLKLLAETNLLNLSRNPYPGRGIIVGLDETGNFLVQVYWIMGRSQNSRNRIFEYEKSGNRLFTTAADPSQVKDASLIMYNAMREAPYKANEGTAYHVVSNGHQTDAVVDCYLDTPTLVMALHKYTYEPDAPNFTPRITAVSCWRQHTPTAVMAILRKSVSLRDACDRQFYEFGNLESGFGHCITTYSGDGNPLPAFNGVPYLLPLRGAERQIAQTYWEALDPDNRVSLAVKFIPKEGHSSMDVLNKY